MRSLRTWVKFSNKAVRADGCPRRVSLTEAAARLPAKAAEQALGQHPAFTEHPSEASLAEHCPWNPRNLQIARCQAVSQDPQHLRQLPAEQALRQKALEAQASRFLQLLYLATGVQLLPTT